MLMYISNWTPFYIHELLYGAANFLKVIHESFWVRFLPVVRWSITNNLGESWANLEMIQICSSVLILENLPQGKQELVLFDLWFSFWRIIPLKVWELCSTHSELVRHLHRWIGWIPRNLQIFLKNDNLGLKMKILKFLGIQPIYT